jgi:molybdate transport system substrate-binding protein
VYITLGGIVRLLLAVVVSLVVSAVAAAETVRVGVAISLKDAANEVARAYEGETGDKVEFTFGSSGQIAAQIKNGAPIDAFISAANKQVDDLERDGLVLPGTRRVVAGNTLALIVPAGADGPDRFEALAREGVKRVAIGEPRTVPAGQYATEVLENLGLLRPLDGRLVYGSNVRQVLNYVERGEVSAGIVYATDAREAGAKVKVTATAPPGTHAPIVYPAVVVKASPHAAAATKFLDYLGTEPAQRTLANKGFTTVTPQPTTRRAAQ